MVDANSIASTALNIGALVFMIIITIVIIGGSFYGYMKWRRYNEYKCIVWERDGFGQLVETYDKAGVFVDPKTQNKRLFLKKFNVGLDPDNIPYLPSIGGGSFSSPKTIYLLRTGLKNFQFIRPDIEQEEITLEVGEEDVNWSINAYERQKRLFSKSKLMELMPYIAIAFVTVIILVIFIYFFKEFSVMKDVAIAFKEASESLAYAKTGTAVVS
jgi:hypothetical protein